MTSLVFSLSHSLYVNVFVWKWLCSEAISKMSECESDCVMNLFIAMLFELFKMSLGAYRIL